MLHFCRVLFAQRSDAPFSRGKACNADLPACARMADLLSLSLIKGLSRVPRHRLPRFRRAADIPSPASFIRDELIGDLNLWL
jgi:hypothetical protein